MKIASLLVCAVVAGVATTSASHGAHHHRHHPHRQPAKQRFQVEAPKAAFDRAFHRVGKKDVDIWQMRAADNTQHHVFHQRQHKTHDDNADLMVRADIYATPEAMARLSAELGDDDAVDDRRHRPHHQQHGRTHHVKQYDEESLVARDRREVAECLARTKGYMDEFDNLERHSDSKYFECFHPHDQVFEFLDALTEANPDLITKYDNVSMTYEGRSIPAYKISTGCHSQDKEPKLALYTQALIHAREWQSGASTVYSMTRFIDDLKAEKPETTELFDTFDWYFVPIVNIDGYVYTWEKDRMWRTSRHIYTDEDGEEVPGIDLNRNFPPDQYFKVDPDDVDEETHPGEYPLSEPSTRGLFHFVKSIDRISGILDMHGYGGQVLRPFSDRPGEPAEPFGSQMRQLGAEIAKTLSQHGTHYVSETGAWLYEAYGCFDDGMFSEYNFTVPAITIEVEGEDFVAPQKTIVPVGKNIYGGLYTFADECLAYHEMVEDLEL
ncbi:TPA: hypothetical protein N0F65_012882 [Lagenidium giganteum]|uniref:Peptidase M14 domain-containing protein n=1 Tax=Lagenidium giganteum TaxID=4803 RepID=A0AAV2YK73_9STRA|nr:TPA: hypothetical protein N0F65_012882 [Lagenidium giganteum]